MQGMCDLVAPLLVIFDDGESRTSGFEKHFRFDLKFVVASRITSGLT